MKKGISIIQIMSYKFLIHLGILTNHTHEERFFALSYSETSHTAYSKPTAFHSPCNDIVLQFPSPSECY